MSRRARFFVLLAASALGVGAAAPRPGVWFRGDFETGGLAGWNLDIARPERAVVVTDPVRKGRYAVRITLAPGDIAASKESQLDPELLGAARAPRSGGGAPPPPSSSASPPAPSSPACALWRKGSSPASCRSSCRPEGERSPLSATWPGRSICSIRMRRPEPGSSPTTRPMRCRETRRSRPGRRPTRHRGAIYVRAVQEALGLAEPPRFELWFLAAGRVVGEG